MKHICIIIAAFAALSFAAAPKQAGQSHDVSIASMKFAPEKLEIAVGDSVVWTNDDDRDHTVVAADRTFKSGNMSKGDTFKYTFTKAGKFSYGCSYHPRMKGVVIVSAASGN